MKWLKLQAVLVALALLAAACQCVVACATEPCQQPQATSHCHKDQAPKPDKTHCVSATVLAEAASNELSLPAPDVFFPAQDTLRALPGCPHTPSREQACAPPSPDIVFSTILRI